MTRYDYAREKLYIAMRSLASGPGDVRARLLNAFLTFHTLKPADFPTQYQKDWTWIIEQMTKYGPIHDYKGAIWKGSVENTMSKIRNRTGQKIANKIFDIGWDLHTNVKFL